MAEIFGIEGVAAELGGGREDCRVPVGGLVAGLDFECGANEGGGSLDEGASKSCSITSMTYSREAGVDEVLEDEALMGRFISGVR